MDEPEPAPAICGEELPGTAMGDTRCALPAGHKYAHTVRVDDLTYTWNAGRFREPRDGRQPPRAAG